MILVFGRVAWRGSPEVHVCSPCQVQSSESFASNGEQSVPDWEEQASCAAQKAQAGMSMPLPISEGPHTGGQSDFRCSSVTLLLESWAQSPAAPAPAARDESLDFLPRRPSDFHIVS